MTNRKTTKRALLGSVLALILCFSMLLGSTYAWFTDTDYVAVNKIQSGTLDVELLDENMQPLVGTTLAFDDLDDNDLWEPGCTYTLPDVYIKNNGNLALKYHLVINGVVGDAKLLEAIEWTAKIGNINIDLTNGLRDMKLEPNQTSSAIKITGHMKESAGNEYQNLTLEGIGITVVATQVPHEFDSTTDQYDQGATYPAAPVIVSTPAELQHAIDNGKPAKLAANITPADGGTEAAVQIAVGQTAVIDLNGYTLGAGAQSANRTNYAVDNYGTLTIVGGGSNDDMINARGIQNFGTLTIDSGVTVNAIDQNGGASVWNEGDLVINGTVLNAAATSLAAPGGAACIINATAGATVEINGAEVTCGSGAYAVINKAGSMTINDLTIVDARGGIACESGTVVINDADVTVNGGTSGWAVYTSGGTITINGGTFVNTGAPSRLFCEDGGQIIDNR